MVGCSLLVVAECPASPVGLGCWPFFVVVWRLPSVGCWLFVVDSMVHVGCRREFLLSRPSSAFNDKLLMHIYSKGKKNTYER